MEKKKNDDIRKKIDNYWYYYKYHTLVGIFAAVLLIIFIKDMLGRVEYDYTVAVITKSGTREEDMEALQSYFEGISPDLNGDGEVHVQVAEYYFPSDDGQMANPQVVISNQTRLMADIQEQESMIFFVDKSSYEEYKEQGLFSGELSELAQIKDCQGFKEMGEIPSIEDLYVTMKDMPEGLSEEEQAYYEASKALFEKFIK